MLLNLSQPNGTKTYCASHIAQEMRRTVRSTEHIVRIMEVYIKQNDPSVSKL